MFITSQRLAYGLAVVLAVGFSAPAEAKCPPGQAKKGNCTAAQTHHPGNGKSHKAKRHNGSARPAARAEPRPHHMAVPVVAGMAAAGRLPRADERLRDDVRIAIGDTLGISRYRRIADPRLFDLPARADGLAYYRVGDRIVLADPRDYRVREVALPRDAQRFCPPGLAKKEPACIPPGQADRILRTQWDDQRFLPIRDYTRYGLPAPGNDWGYYVVDNTIVRVDERSRQILSLVRLIDAIL